MNCHTDWNCRLFPCMRERIIDASASIEGMRVLYDRFGFKRFCMMPEYDARRETVSMFLLRRFRSEEMLKPLLPKEWKIRYASRVLLTPNLHRTESLHKLCLSKNKYLPISLPIAEYDDWMDFELNRLLYQSHFKLLMTSCELYPIFTPPEALKRIFHMENAIYQFNYKALTEPDICRIISYLVRRNKTVLLGTSLDCAEKAWQYDFTYYLEASDNHMYFTHLQTVLDSTHEFWKM